jgi:hypothetical protein
VFPGWTLLAAPALEALLWPVASLLLLAPQRRAPDRDENRPLCPLAREVCTRMPAEGRRADERRRDDDAPLAP